MPQFLYSRVFLTISATWIVLVLYLTSPLPYLLADPLIAFHRNAITVWTLCATIFLVWACTKTRGRAPASLWTRYLFAIILLGIITLPWTIGEAGDYREPTSSLTSYLTGITLVVLLLSLWRILGIWIMLICALFLANFIWGHHLSGALFHKEMELSSFLQALSASHINISLITDLVIPLVLLGSILDSLIARFPLMKKSTSRALFNKLQLGNLPLFFRRHFWVLTLFLTFFTEQIWSYFQATSDIITQIVQFLIPSIIIALIVSALLLTLKLIKKFIEPTPPIAERVTGAMSYLGFFAVGFGMLFPGGPTYAVWAWRDRRGSNLSEQNRLRLPLNYLSALLLIFTAAISILLLQILLWQALEWIDLSKFMGRWGNKGLSTTFIILFLLTITFSACALKKQGYGRFIGLLALISTLVGLMFLLTQLKFSQSLSLFHMTIPALLVLLGSGLISPSPREHGPFGLRTHWRSIGCSLLRSFKPLLMRFPVMAIIFTLTALYGDVIITVVDQTGIGGALLNLIES